jgi:hypothetical protein
MERVLSLVLSARYVAAAVHVRQTHRMQDIDASNATSGARR